MGKPSDNSKVDIEKGETKGPFKRKEYLRTKAFQAIADMVIQLLE